MTENGSYSGGRPERASESRHGYSSRDYHGSEHRRDRDRGDRSERPDRGDRSDRAERSERGGRSDRGDRDRERGDRDRGDRHRERDRGDRDRGDRDRDSDRRRSRSPGYRSSRTSRRDYPDEPSSSSRYDRDRDRDFGGRHGESRHGRSDREWDRERGPRRERDERGGRSKPDDRGGRDFGRKRSVTPPSKKREPTPDLTDIVPINERKRRMTMWDIKPQGYENVTAEQAKLSGMFPLPGAPRQTPMDPTRLQVFINQPGNIASATALKPTNSRQAKRLMIRNLPQNADGEELKALFNETLRGLNVVQGGSEPVTRANVSDNKKLGLLEFAKTEDCTVGLAFTGIEYKGKKLEISRPKDYIVPLPDESVNANHESGNISSEVPDSPNKILVANILPTLQDAQLIDLLKTFGELKAFVLVKNTEFDQSVGIAFCEFVDPQVTDVVVDSLNNMELGDRNLRVQRASIGLKQSVGMDMNVNAMAMMAGTTSSDLEPSRVLQLLNMVTAEELADDEEYEDIRDDIKEECSKFGTVLDVKIPRPSGSGQTEPGVGKIYVLFKQVDAAGRGLKALAGRKFQDRTVVVTYFPEEIFEVSAW